MVTRQNVLSTAVACVLLLACTLRVAATPLVLFLSKNGIWIGTNEKSSSGADICKLLTSSHSVFLRSTFVAELDRPVTLEPIFDPSIDLLRVITQAGSHAQLESSAVKSLETSAKAITKLMTPLKRSQSERDAFLESMRSDVILASVVHGHMEVSLFAVSFADWANPKATIKIFSIPPERPIRIMWAGHNDPMIAPLPISDPNRYESFLRRQLSDLDSFYATHDPDKATAFHPPFDVVHIDQAGVHWLPTECNPCEKEHRRAFGVQSIVVK